MLLFLYVKLLAFFTPSALFFSVALIGSMKPSNSFLFCGYCLLPSPLRVILFTAAYQCPEQGLSSAELNTYISNEG